MVDWISNIMKKIRTSLLMSLKVGRLVKTEERGSLSEVRLSLYGVKCLFLSAKVVN